jgi:hypothetical protein
MKISGKLILAASLAIASFNGFAQESQLVSPSSHKKILIVVTSHDQLGNTGKKQEFGLRSSLHLIIILPRRELI